MRHEKHFHRIPSGLALLAFTALLTACGGQKARMQEIDGVLHVMNPADPMKPNMKVELVEELRYGQDEGEDEYIFPGITGFVADEEGMVYILMRQDDEVRVFGPDGTYSHTIGRQGDGPGELRVGAGINIGPEGNIWVVSMLTSRLVIFQKDGLFLRNIQFPLLPPFFIQLTDDGFMGLYMQQRIDEENRLVDTTFKLQRFNADGDTLNTLFTTNFTLDIMNMQFGGMADKFPFYTQDDQGRVWQARALNDAYEVNVWNPEGSLDRVIEKEFDRLEKTDEEIVEEQEMVRRMLQAQLSGAELPEGMTMDYEPDRFRPATGMLYFDPHGYVWVQAGREGTQDMNAFDLFDMRGQYMRRVIFEGLGSPAFLAFVGDKLYLIDADPEVSPQVIRYSLNID